MRAIVCGGRDLTNREYVFSTLDTLRKTMGLIHVIEGGQRRKDIATGHFDGGAKVSQSHHPEQGQPMTKAELNALEKVFAAEIDNRLPFQSKAKIFQRLCDDGYLKPMHREYRTGAFAVNVDGYQLTHLGRLSYCATCADEQSLSDNRG